MTIRTIHRSQHDIIKKNTLRQHVAVTVLLLLCAAILLVNLGGRDLWNPDEPRYAQVARVMLQTGQYLLPHLNGEIYPDKPPLFFWLIALVSFPLGDVNPYSARLPSALACIGTLLATYLMGKKLFNHKTGLLAAALLFTSGDFFLTAASVHIDISLTLCTTFSLLLFLYGYTGANRQRIFYMSSYACMGIAVLLKGPVGYFIPVVSIITYLALTKKLSSLTKIYLGKGTLLVAAMVSLWLVPACILGGHTYTSTLLGKQIFGRLVHSYSHRNPFYYYLIVFPAGFLPWSLFIPAASFYFWKHKASRKDILFPLAWFAATFIFFSLISGKRNLYVLPLYPAAALLTAVFFIEILSGWQKKSVPRRMVRATFFLLFGILLLAGLAVPTIIAGGFAFTEQILSIRTLLYSAAGIFFLFGSAGMAVLATKKGFLPLLYCALAFMLTVCLASVLWGFPAFNRFKSAQPFCEKIARRVKADDPLIASFTPDLFNYYLNRSIEAPLRGGDLESSILQEGKNFYIIREKDYTKLSDESKDRVSIILTDTIGHRTYMLLLKET